MCAHPGLFFLREIEMMEVPSGRRYTAVIWV